MRKEFDIDKTDRSLLFEIDLDARASFAELGRRTGLSKETAANRIRRLEERGIISHYSTIVNFAKLGNTGYGVLVQLRNADEEKKKEVLQALSQYPSVYWVAILGGQYDLLFAIHAPNIIEFDQIFSNIGERFREYFFRTDIATRIQVTQFRRDYLLNRRSKYIAPYFGRRIEHEKLDKLDRDILCGLGENARTSTKELATRLGMPRTTIQNRLRALEKRGIIQGYSAHIHAELFGYQIYQIHVTVSSRDSETRRMFYEWAEKSPYITFFVDVVGKWDFEIVCEVPNPETLQQLLSELRNRYARFVVNTETILFFDYYLKYAFTP